MGQHFSEDCGHTFLTNQALARHAFRAHGKKHSIAPCVTGSTCRACLGFYHTREIRAGHLKSQYRCALLLVSNVEPASVEEREQGAAEELEHLKGCKQCEYGPRTLPRYRSEGTLPRRAQTTTGDEDECTAGQDLYV